MDIEKFESDLNHFTGTEEWHVWSILYPRFVLTDGAKYVADTAGAYWLMDIIASYQSMLLRRNETFQVWKMALNFEAESGREMVIFCDDGNGHTLVQQTVPYTDFPLHIFKLYAIHDGSGYMTILLPSEY